MPARGPRDMSMPNTTPSQPPSEAQSRGIYGSSHSPISNVTHLGRYELKRSPNEEASDRAVKRRRHAEEEEEEEDDDDDGPIAPSDNDKPPSMYSCKNWPRTCNAHKLIEPASSRAGIVTLEKIVIPSRGGSEHRQASQSRMSASNGEGAIETTTDQYLHHFLHTPIPGSNTNQPSRTPSQAEDQSSQVPIHNKDFIPTSAPNERSTDDGLDTIQARMRAFEEEERVRQKQHEEELARRRLQQKLELERELDEKINQKRHDADMARRAAVQKQEEEHERILDHLRRR